MNQNQTPAWNTYSRTRHHMDSGTYMDSNDTYANYSSGHLISVDSKFQNAYFKA